MIFKETNEEVYVEDEISKRVKTSPLGEFSFELLYIGKGVQGDELPPPKMHAITRNKSCLKSAKMQ